MVTWEAQVLLENVHVQIEGHGGDERTMRSKSSVLSTEKMPSKWWPFVTWSPSL